jgi:hypothetical protein
MYFIKSIKKIGIGNTNTGQSAGLLPVLVHGSPLKLEWKNYKINIKYTGQVIAIITYAGKRNEMKYLSLYSLHWQTPPSVDGVGVPPCQWASSKTSHLPLVIHLWFHYQIHWYDAGSCHWWSTHSWCLGNCRHLPFHLSWFDLDWLRPAISQFQNCGF